MNWPTAAQLVIAELTVVVSLLIGLALEHVRPTGNKPDTARFNLVYAAIMAIVSSGLVQPLAGIELAYLANRIGTPPIELPSTGWPVAVSVFALLLTKDFVDYWVHRAQHRFSLLWSMHSFHHSDDAMNITTSQRHFWLEQVVTACVIYIPMGLFVRFSGLTALFFTLGAMFFSLFPHMNLRLEFGRLSWLLLGPQLHRTHHSVLPEHFNRNYAGVFPMWDVLFGTYKAPGRREFPDTGIGETRRVDLWTAFVWPMRG